MNKNQEHASGIHHRRGSDTGNAGMIGNFFSVDDDFHSSL